MNSRTVWGLSAYQWLVLFAAWLGWGFDVFDALLFNYVSRLCVPSLLGVPANDVNTITLWTGRITSVLLIGWALGGIIFGQLTDKIGRSRTLLLTMLTYAIATAACAFAPNIWILLLFRFIASLGIGGEWAAGVSLVAETVPENKRVQAGALLYTAAPFGLFLATFVTDLFTRQLDFIASDPNLAWRAVFLTGLIPAGVAILIRLKVQEPGIWSGSEKAPRISELFTPELRGRTIGGIAMAAVALITWWSCNTFVPTIASFLVYDLEPVPVGQELLDLKARFVTIGTTAFNLGGLIGTLMTVPVALVLGRRTMFAAYFLISALAIFGTFGLNWEPMQRLYLIFTVGLSVFGVFGSFTFYLPELFPTRLRGTGSGFTYNVARFVTALGPFLVGAISQGAKSSADVLAVLSWIAIVPVLGLLFVFCGVVHETKGLALSSQTESNKP